MSNATRGGGGGGAGGARNLMGIRGKIITRRLERIAADNGGKKKTRTETGYP